MSLVSVCTRLVPHCPPRAASIRQGIDAAALVATTLMVAQPSLSARAAAAASATKRDLPTNGEDAREVVADLLFEAPGA